MPKGTLAFPVRRNVRLSPITRKPSRVNRFIPKSISLRQRQLTDDGNVEVRRRIRPCTGIGAAVALSRKSRFRSAIGFNSYVLQWGSGLPPLCRLLPAPLEGSLKVPSEERNPKAARPADLGFSRHEGIVS